MSDSELKEYCERKKKEKINDGYTMNMLQNLRDKIGESRINTARQKARIENSRPIHEKILLYLKRNKSTIKDILAPFLILFFPFKLHPLR